MKQAVRAGGLLAAAMIIVLPARADLVLKDSIYGPGTIIEDTTTHLDWLKLTVTQDRSFNDIASKFGAGQEFAGFSYGDVIQVGQLFKDGGLPSIVPSDTSPWGNLFSSTNPSDVAAVTNMINLFGSTNPTTDFPLDAIGILGNHDLSGFGPDERDGATLGVQTTLACAVVHCATAEPFSGSSVGPGVLDTPESQAGSWLVESAPAAVPEPNMAVLVGIGFGLVVLRKVLC